MFTSRSVVKRRRRRSAQRSAQVTLAASFALLASGLTLLCIGGWSWTLESPAPLKIVANTPVNTGTTPWFTPGSTVFSTPRRSGGIPQPAELGCELYSPDGDRQLLNVANIDVMGTRVVNQISLSPITVIGKTKDRDRIECSGPLMNTLSVWVLPTNAAPDRTPMALVVAGLALMGLGALINPYARGARRELG